MKKETALFLNNLANRYSINDDEAVFSSLYKTLASELGLKLKNWETTTYLAENHDITDLFHDALMKSLDKLKVDGGGDFLKIFMFSLHNNYKSLLRKLRTRRKNEWLFSFTNKETDDEESESFSRMYEVRSEVDIEGDFLKRQEIKTNADKSKLISELVIDGDSVTTAIVNEYLNWTSSERLTPTAIGRKLGIHHEIVKRRLNKLAKGYNERQFGSIDAYLAV